MKLVDNKNNAVLQRLITEWQTHGKIVLAVDFDDTLHPWKFKELNPNVVPLVKEAQTLGCYTVIWTACDESRYPKIHSVCSSLGIKVDGINVVPLDLPYGKGRKIYYNLLLDDRAGLNEACELLHDAIQVIRTDKHLNKPIPSDAG